MAYQNFYATKLGNQIGASDTTIAVQTPPTVTSGRLVLEPRNAQKREIIEFTGVSGLDLTGVTRGLYGTSASIHSSGSLVEMNFLAEDYTDLTTAFESYVATTSDWRDVVPAVSSVTHNGQRSYDLTTDTDQTAVISPGMRLRTTRTVAAPTQCTDLEASSSQYYSKSSPSGMTFTDDFVVSAWVKLESYTGQVVASRYNGTSGWRMYIESTGQVILQGYNGGVANTSYVQTYQSLPLGKWVHVAAQLDMSAFTATTTTSYVMLDGLDVPATVVRTGTSPTALIQAGNLEIGGQNGGASPFDGKIAQVAIYSAKVTQANVRATISQGLSGSETSLISAYSFNGVITDLSANANNLTANGSAVATDADSPFGGQADGTISSTLDYGIVQKVTASTITVQVAEGCTIPTSGGVASASYSTYKSPFGFPGQPAKWSVQAIYRSTNSNVASPGTQSWQANPGLQIVEPLGSWERTYQLPVYGARASGQLSFLTTLSETSAAETDPLLTFLNYSNAVSENSTTAYRSMYKTNTAATTLYVNQKPTVVSMNAVAILGTSSAWGDGLIELRNAYL